MKLGLSPLQWCEYITKINKANRDDHYGISIETPVRMFEASPSTMTACFEDIAASIADMAFFALRCPCTAKEASLIAPSRTRVILPLPNVLLCIDACVSKQLTVLIEVAGFDLSFMQEWNLKKKCTTDLASALKRAVEKGIDTMGAAAIASQEIVRYYDSLCHRLCFNFVRNTLRNEILAAHLLRLHTSPSSFLVAAGMATRELVRNISVITGCMSAVILVRLPVIDMCLNLLGAIANSDPSSWHTPEGAGARLCRQHL